MSGSRHGALVRGLDGVSLSSIRDARFGRMFRNLPAAPFTEAALLALGETMIQGEFADRIAKNEPVDTPLNEIELEDENSAIPSGYTYLGQFIDHDLTFDPVSSLDRFNDPDALQDFRTPRLDLDSIYGSGPADQPFLYQEDGAHFLLGDDCDFDRTRRQRPDLPRNTPPEHKLDPKPNPLPPRRALIGDKRNDENLIVSQLHVTFLRFHNAVLDHLTGGTQSTTATFDEAQRLVRWHYQWIVLHDFIKRIVGDQTYKTVIGGAGEIPNVRFYESKGRFAFMPVEFSAAAYRFGHSMVRPSYALNHIVKSATPPDQPFKGQTAKFNRIPIFSSVNSANQPLANLNGFRELPDFWAMDWGFFFPDVQAEQPPQGAVLPQPSYKIDSVLADPLAFLPDQANQPAPRQVLANLNLLRGWRLQLPSGQSVAQRMGLAVLTDKQLFSHDDGAVTAARLKVIRDHPIFEGNAPLWFYILRESELVAGGAHLGPVGGTIVADVLAGLMLEDRHSFLSQAPKWKPTLPAAAAGHFTMSDLINFTNARPGATS